MLSLPHSHMLSIPTQERAAVSLVMPRSQVTTIGSSRGTTLKPSPTFSGSGPPSPASSQKWYGNQPSSASVQTFKYRRRKKYSGHFFRASPIIAPVCQDD